MRLPLKLKIVENTPIGDVGIVWTEFAKGPRAVEVLLPGTGFASDGEVEKGSSPEIEAVAEMLRAILKGRKIRISLKALALEDCLPFQQDVLRATARIPRGRVTTYRGLAESLGREKAARAVGNALATNPFPLIIPCHRVIRSDGRIGGFAGGAGMKRKLLELEGVGFDDTNRITSQRFLFSQGS